MKVTTKRDRKALIDGIFNGREESAEPVLHAVQIADEHGAKCPCTNKTPAEVLEGMLLCPILRGFAKARKK